MFLEGQKFLPSIPQKRLFAGRGWGGRKKSVRTRSSGSFFCFYTRAASAPSYWLFQVHLTPHQSPSQFRGKVNVMFHSALGISNRILQLLPICNVCSPLDTSGHIPKIKNIS